MKMIIQPCTILKNGDLKSGLPIFPALINPESYKRDYAISYSKDKAQGKLAPELKFTGTDSEKIAFDLVLDGTGVVNKNRDVAGQIMLLKSIVYDYKGNTHEPSPAKLVWGALIFFGRLTSMNISYTLFTPEGIPLRAKISLSFSKYVSREEESKRAARSSPDLTHTFIIKDGDTLPLLCDRIYSDSSLYLRIAKENKLSDFRNLKPGTRVHFPPLQELNL